MFGKSYFIKHYEKLSLVHNVVNKRSVKASIYCSVAFFLHKLHIRIKNDSLNDNTLLMVISPFICTLIFYSFPCSRN